MALDKLVDSTQLDSDLTSVANAIRTKGGTSAQLAFPAGFVSAINDISGGGGYAAADWLDWTKPTGNISTGKTYSSTDGSKQYLLYGRTGVGDVTFTNATYITDHCMQYCGVTKLTAKKATTFGPNACASATRLVYVIAPVLKLLYASVFQSCTELLGADFGGSPSSSQGFYRQSAFSGASKLNALVLRGSAVWPLSNINNFANTCFASGKSGGILYVPASMISSYQSASNWSTILGYTNNQIKSIESTHTDPDAPIDLTLYYIDGTTIPST